MTIKKDSNSPMSNLKSTQVSAVFEDENAVKPDESGDRLKPEDAVTDTSDSDVPVKDTVISYVPDLGINRLVSNALSRSSFMASLPPEKLPDGWKPAESVIYEPPAPKPVKDLPPSTVPGKLPLQPSDEVPSTKKINMPVKPNHISTIPPATEASPSELENSEEKIPSTKQVNMKEKSPEVLAAELLNETLPVTQRIDMQAKTALELVAKTESEEARQANPAPENDTFEEESDDAPSTKKVDMPIKGKPF